MNIPFMPAQPAPTWTLQQLRRHFDMIPAERILLDPPPGTATEKDLERVNGRKEHLCELIDGVLVEKAMGTKEGLLGGWLLHMLWNHLEGRDLGIVLPGDAMLRLFPGMIRVPDVSFISAERLPGGQLPDESIASLSPDLAVEVISPGNTKKEIARKLREYFASGTRLAWIVQPRTRSVEVYTSATEKKVLSARQSLDGGDVLPGFRLSLTRLFAPGAGR
jgi:Uma2 family endonuclease